MCVMSRQRMKMSKVALCSDGWRWVEAAGFRSVSDMAVWVGLPCVERCGHSSDRHTWHLHES